MVLQNQGIRISDVVELGNNGPSVELNNRPTLTVSRSTAESAVKSLNLTNIQAVNFIAGVNAILQSATIKGPMLFVNTQPGVVNLTLDNGGTIKAQAIYQLVFGTTSNPVTFGWDGTNLT